MTIQLTPVRYYSDNDVYHYTVDNRPLQDLAANDAALLAEITASDPDSVSQVTSLDGTEYISAKKSGSWLGTTLSTIAKFVITTFSGFTQTGTGSISRTVQGKLTEIFSVKDFGAKGDGVTDDTAAIQSALNACSSYGTVFFPPGIYVVSSTLTIPSSYIRVTGPAKIIAAASTNFDYIMLASGQTGVAVERLEFDANKTNRTAGQNIRFMGAGLVNCTDSYFAFCTARNTRGYASIPAVGLAIAGVSIRCGVYNCYLENCGDAAPNASDAVYTSGTQTVIANSTALNCTDTAFVLESSNQSIISGCTSVNCSVGGAITNATNTDCYGNVINGLTIENWNSSVTGGIQIGVPTSTTGNLYDTSISNIVMHANTSGGYGTGPAINVRQQGAGKAIDLSISNVRIDGASTQGILVDAQEVSITGSVVKGCGSSNIQFNSGTQHFVSGNQLVGGTFGVIATNSASVVCQLNYCQSPTNNGIYAFNTSTIRSIFNTVITPGSGYEGSDAGATLYLIGHREELPAFNRVTNSAPTGSAVKKITAYDNTGTPIGVIPVYSS